MSYRYAHLHGFASSSASRKGTFLRLALAADGIDLVLPDLNAPSFEKQTYTAALRALDAMDAGCLPGARWRLTGSSLGGYLAARWAAARPDRVDRLFLLCPGFDLVARWPRILGADAMRRWERDGALELDDASGRPRPLHWEFIEDARTHPPFPEVACPARILHGTRDEVVPVDSSRAYARDRPHVSLLEVDDDHSLMGSLERIAEEIRRFFGDAGATRTRPASSSER